MAMETTEVEHQGDNHLCNSPYYHPHVCLLSVCSPSNLFSLAVSLVLCLFPSAYSYSLSLLRTNLCALLDVVSMEFSALASGNCPNLQNQIFYKLVIFQIILQFWHQKFPSLKRRHKRCEWAWGMTRWLGSPGVRRNSQFAAKVCLSRIDIEQHCFLLNYCYSTNYCFCYYHIRVYHVYWLSLRIV